MRKKERTTRNQSNIAPPGGFSASGYERENDKVAQTRRSETTPETKRNGRGAAAWRWNCLAMRRPMTSPTEERGSLAEDGVQR